MFNKKSNVFWVAVVAAVVAALTTIVLLALRARKKANEVTEEDFIDCDYDCDCLYVDDEVEPLVEDDFDSVEE